MSGGWAGLLGITELYSQARTGEQPRVVQARYHRSYALIFNSMSESRTPELGINSWLEDELYQQYLNDRKTVDESWKEVFETNGGTAPKANVTHEQPAVAVQHTNQPSQPVVPEHQPVAGETLMPLRGAAARIAENM